MAPLGITAFEVSLFIHITAVVLGLGATFAESITFPVAMKLDPRHLPYVHRLHLAINRWFTTPALVVILLTGVYLVEEGGYDFGAAWVSAGLGIVVVLGGLIGAYFIPADRRLAEMAEREIEAAGAGEVVLSDDYQRRARMTGIVGGITGVLIVAAIFLMVVKPGA